MTVRSVAVVGLNIGRSHIVEGYVPNADRFRLAAICDLDEARLASVGDEFGVARRTRVYQELLDDPDIDIIDICTPPNLHRPQVEAALAAGKHVICEKPLTGSLSDVDAIIAAEAGARGVLMPIFQYRYGDGVEKAKRIVDLGIAGRPYLGTVETLWTRGADYYAVPWRGKWATELGGCLVTHALHQHDMLTQLMGPVARVFGRVATRVNDIEVEDCAVAALTLASGALATLSVTLGSREEISRLRLQFENVTFESNHAAYSPGNDPWRIIPKDEATQARIDGALAGWQKVGPRFTTQMLRFHDHLEGRGPLPVSSADARAALELVTAIYQASDSGAEVSLPIGSDSPKYTNWRARTRAEEAA